MNKKKSHISDSAMYPIIEATEKRSITIRLPWLSKSCKSSLLVIGF
jgi:hypothetical protein